MRIDKIIINNIYSLRGAHEINFKKINQHSTLFAITGPTGSGKSSILNAISLALFGETYNSNLNGYDFITLGKREASTKLYVNISGKDYIFSWNCIGRDKDGNILKSARQSRTIEFDGSTHSSQIKELSLRILKLDHEQFTKAVILNQGKFSDFITQSFTYRREILEKLYNGEGLKFLAKNLNTQIKQLRHERVEFEKEIQGATLLTKTEEKELNLKSKSLTKKHSSQLIHNKTLSIICKNLSIVINNKTQNLNLDISLTEKFESINKLTKDLNIGQSDLEEIAKEKDFFLKHYSNFKPLLEKGVKLNLTLKESNAPIDRIGEKINIELTSINDQLENKDNLQKEIAQIDLELSSSTDTEVENSFKITKEPIINTLLSHTEVAISTITYTENDNRDNSIKNEAIIIDIGKDKDLLNETLHRLREINSKKLSEEEYIKNETTYLSEKNNLIDNIKEEIVKDRDRKAIIIELELNIKKQNSELKLFNTQLKNEAIELKHLNETLDLLKENISLNKLNEAITTCYTHGKKSGICPVCTTTLSHIEHKNLKVHINDNSKEEILENKILLKKQNQIRLKEKTKGIQGLINEQKEKKQTIKSKNSTQAEQLSNDLSKLTEERDLIEDNLTNFRTNCITYRHNKRNLADKELSYKELSLKIKKGNKLINDNISLIEQNRIDLSSLLFCNLDISLTHSKSQTHFKRVFSLQKEKHLLRQKLSQVENNLKDSEKRLNNYKEENLELSNRKSSLLKELNDLNIGKTPPEIQLTSLLEENEKIKEKSQNKKIKIDKLIHEIKNCQYSISLLEESIKNLHNDNSSSFSLITEQSKSIDKSLMDNRLERIISKLNSSVGKDEKNNTLIISDITLEYLNKIQDNSTLLFDQLNETLIKIDEQLRINNLQKDKIEVIQIEVEKIVEDLTTKEELSSIIGNEKFRNFTLSLIEKQLIAYSNTELNSLCDGRYKIIQKENNGKPAFFVIDYLKGGEHRKIATLSGGETFMISLAMALSLAEMTRGVAQIDSFFIDEGFGSLDEDSLEEVLEVLLNIRSRGKHIGIISHIKDLTQKIPVNINLIKNRSGDSRIDVSYS